MTKIMFVLHVTAACASGSVQPAAAPHSTGQVPMAAPVASEPATPTHPSEPAAPGEQATPAEPPPPDPATLKTELLAVETAAFEKAKPVFDKYCAKCHTKTGSKATKKKLDHFDMTTYPFDGHHAMDIAREIRKSLGIDGSKPTMPFDRKGTVKGDELALIATWADAFEASRHGGAHVGHGNHGHGNHKH